MAGAAAGRGGGVGAVVAARCGFAAMGMLVFADAVGFQAAFIAGGHGQNHGVGCGAGLGGVGANAAAPFVV